MTDSTPSSLPGKAGNPAADRAPEASNQRPPTQTTACRDIAWRAVATPSGTATYSDSSGRSLPQDAIAPSYAPPIMQYSSYFELYGYGLHKISFFQDHNRQSRNRQRNTDGVPLLPLHPCSPRTRLRRAIVSLLRSSVPRKIERCQHPRETPLAASIQT